MNEVPPLAISVGPASKPIRLLIAFVFVVIATAAAIGSAYLLDRPAVMTRVVALLLTLPLAPLALIAALYVLAPLSPFGRWIANDRATAPPFAVLAAAWLPSALIAIYMLVT